MTTLEITIPYENIDLSILNNKILLYERENLDNAEIEFEKNLSHELYRNYTFNMLINDVNEDQARILALNWTCKRIISLYIHIDTVSFFEDLKIPIYCYDEVFECIKTKLYNYFEEDYSLLGVLEKSPNKGYHLHLLHISSNITNKKNLEKLLKYLENISISFTINPHNQEDVASTINNNIKYSILVNGEIVKSPGGIYNYLQKNIIRVYSDDIEAVKMFMYFKKEYIFPKGTEAKYQKLDKQRLQLTKDPLTILLYNLFSEGKYDYTDVIQDIRIQPYLCKTNLKTVYSNVFSNYSASLTHIKNLILLCNKYKMLQPTERCACPVLEFINYQNINVHTFLEQTFKWLTCLQKKNCLWFYGPADCGKSHLARLIWKCFTLNTRIIADGIFSFANLLRSGCALWDEPFIGPDLADQTKLVLEGEPDIDITIKNRNSERLGKRVPIIITSNSLLWKYCSGERVPFEQRTYQLNFIKPITSEYFCNETEHYCPFLDSTDSSYNPFTNDGSLSNNKRRRSSETGILNCEKNHRIEQNHVISFLILSLQLYKQHIKIFSRDGTQQEYQELYDNLKSFENTLCSCSANLNIRYG